MINVSDFKEKINLFQEDKADSSKFYSKVHNRITHGSFLFGLPFYSTIITIR